MKTRTNLPQALESKLRVLHYLISAKVLCDRTSPRRLPYWFWPAAQISRELHKRFPAKSRAVALNNTENNQWNTDIMKKEHLEPPVAVYVLLSPAPRVHLCILEGKRNNPKYILSNTCSRIAVLKKISIFVACGSSCRSQLRRKPIYWTEPCLFDFM